jgi:hypothetical protein
MTFDNLVNKYRRHSFLIVGCGSTLNIYREQLERFINKERPVIITINNPPSWIRPFFNIWTNTGRLKTFWETAEKAPFTLLGSRLGDDYKKMVGDYIEVPYTDNMEEKIGYDGHYIRGFYRTAGCLSIMIAHLFGATKTYIAGMDGYMLKANGNQHCYGSGDTDSSDEKYCEDKDCIIYSVLDSIKAHGIKFKIITPTVYEGHYDQSVLAANN